MPGGGGGGGITSTTNSGFVWAGLLGVVGLIVAAVLAVVLAVPAGALVARLTRRPATA